LNYYFFHKFPCFRHWVASHFHPPSRAKNKPNMYMLLVPGANQMPLSFSGKFHTPPFVAVMHLSKFFHSMKAGFQLHHIVNDWFVPSSSQCYVKYLIHDVIAIENIKARRQHPLGSNSTLMPFLLPLQFFISCMLSEGSATHQKSFMETNVFA